MNGIFANTIEHTCIVELSKIKAQLASQTLTVVPNPVKKYLTYSSLFSSSEGNVSATQFVQDIGVKVQNNKRPHRLDIPSFELYDFLRTKLAHCRCRIPHHGSIQEFTANRGRTFQFYVTFIFSVYVNWDKIYLKDFVKDTITMRNLLTMIRKCVQIFRDT